MKTKLKCFVFVRRDEMVKYAGQPMNKPIDLVCIPDSCKDLGATRQFIIEWCAERAIKKCIMMDDDLRFFARDPDNKFSRAGERDVEKMLRAIEDRLTDNTIVGIPGRFLANNLPRTYTENKRPACCFGINVPDFIESGVKYGTIKVQIDIKVGLELLLKGYSNLQLTEWAHDQKFDQPGGCQNYRTAKVLAAASHQLAKEFPDFVSVFEKKSSSTFKTASVNGVRTEVRVQWAKAAKHGEKHARHQRT